MFILKAGIEIAKLFLNKGDTVWIFLSFQLVVDFCNPYTTGAYFYFRVKVNSFWAFLEWRKSRENVGGFEGFK
jgi:hypothetical protein